MNEQLKNVADSTIFLKYHYRVISIFCHLFSYCTAHWVINKTIQSSLFMKLPSPCSTYSLCPDLSFRGEPKLHSQSGKSDFSFFELPFLITILTYCPV